MAREGDGAQIVQTEGAAEREQGMLVCARGGRVWLCVMGVCACVGKGWEGVGGRGSEPIMVPTVKLVSTMEEPSSGSNATL